MASHSNFVGSLLASPRRSAFLAGGESRDQFFRDYAFNSQVPHLVSSDPPDRLPIVGYVEPFLEILSFIECWDKN